MLFRCSAGGWIFRCPEKMKTKLVKNRRHRRRRRRLRNLLAYYYNMAREGQQLRGVPYPFMHDGGRPPRRRRAFSIIFSHRIYVSTLNNIQ